MLDTADDRPPVHAVRRPPGSGSRSPGEYGVPADAVAVVATVTAINPSGANWVTVVPSSASVPDLLAQNRLVTVLNMTDPFQAIANLAQVKLGPDGLDLVSLAPCDMVLDVIGYYRPVAAAVRVRSLRRAVRCTPGDRHPRHVRLRRPPGRRSRSTSRRSCPPTRRAWRSTSPPPSASRPATSPRSRRRRPPCRGVEPQRELRRRDPRRGGHRADPDGDRRASPHPGVRAAAGEADRRRHRLLHERVEPAVGGRAVRPGRPHPHPRHPRPGSDRPALVGLDGRGSGARSRCRLGLDRDEPHGRVFARARATSPSVRPACRARPRRT